MGTKTSNMCLTQVVPEKYEEDSELPIEATHPAAELISYGLRLGCTEAEFHLANLAQNLRELAFRYARDLQGTGLDALVNEEDLRLLDVHIEVNEIKRLCK